MALAFSTHLGDILDLSGDAQNTVLYTLDDLADTSLDLVLVPDPSDGLSLLSDDDTGFLGADKRTDRDGTRSVLARELGEVVGLVDVVALLGGSRGGHLSFFEDAEMGCKQGRWMIDRGQGWSSELHSM